MEAYKKYLVYLSEKLTTINAEITQVSALETIIKTCLLEKQPMMFEIMKEYGHTTYTENSFKDVATKLIQTYQK